MARERIRKLTREETRTAILAAQAVCAMIVQFGTFGEAGGLKVSEASVLLAQEADDTD